VTAESLAKARRLWARAGIHDYTLEWTSAGKASAYYKVRVRDDQVRTIEQVLPDGRLIPLHPGMPRYFGVDGLFLTMADDYAQLAKERPFDQPKGTKAVLLFTPDPTYGYPRSYRRDVVGAPLQMSIDVVRLTPDPPAAKPPPP
jgi:hypothetical protein